jgi:hypothetical protein
LSYDPQKELAKFGYRQERKVQNLKNPPIFCSPVGTHCLNMAISEPFFPQNLTTLFAFFPQESLVPVSMDFFGCYSAKIHRKGKHCLKRGP